MSNNAINSWQGFCRSLGKNTIETSTLNRHKLIEQINTSRSRTPQGAVIDKYGAIRKLRLTEEMRRARRETYSSATSSITKPTPSDLGNVSNSDNVWLPDLWNHHGKAMPIYFYVEFGKPAKPLSKLTTSETGQT